MKKPIELKRRDYTLLVNYSQQAIDQKLMKFVTPSGEAFEVSAEEMSTILIGQVNNELIAATFVESDRVNVVEVTRQIRATADRDIKKGEAIRIDYTHPYPIEFALIEEGMKLAKINRDVPVFSLTNEYLENVRTKITPEQIKFIDKFYDFIKGLWINGKRKFIK